MKKKVYLYLLLLMLNPLAVLGQECENYVVTRTMLNATGSQYTDKVDYYDGLGRPIETVLRNITPQGNSIVTLQEYDNQSRPVKAWQPVVSSAQGFVPAATVAALSSAQYGDSHAYTTTIYEPSPTENVDATVRPGANLADKPIITRRLVNDSTAELRCYDLRVTSGGSLLNHRLYPNGSLLATKTTDEDGKSAIEFKDGCGRVVLTRSVISAGNYADTYHVYDNYGDLRYIVPPLAADEIARSSAVSSTWDCADAVIDRYCYYYERDILGHVTLKKLPGREKIIYKYDAGNRLTLSQDGNQRSRSLWTYYFYDKVNRLAVSGEMTFLDNETEELLATPHEAVYSGQNSDIFAGYTVSGNIVYSDDLYTVDIANYYDDYSFLGEGSMYAYENSLYSDAQHSSAVGRLTGTVISGRITAYYYDDMGNIVQQHGNHHKVGTTRQYNKYTFTGQPLSSRTVQTINTNNPAKRDTVIEESRYVYDTAGRLIDTYHRLNGREETRLSHNQYSELQQVASQQLGSAVTATYSYDLQGRLRSISSQPFTQTIGYEENNIYNGNIATNSWDCGDGIQRSYCYGYDGMNRLTSAQYGGSVANAFSTSYSYDKHSNPTSISRRGILYKTASGVEYGHVDQLTFDYIGNQIDYVYENSEACDYEGATDFQEIPGSTTYQWDANGNMKRDPSRGITSITYYSTNQPRKITFDNGNSVSFQYDAAGNKQSMQYLVSDMSVALPGGMAQYGSYRRLRRDYIGNCVYRNDTIETIHTATGYIDGAGRYFHYLKDYQGNIRAVVSHSGQIIERNNYYPYGMLMPEDGNDAQSYKYGGKELYRMEGMNLYDFHARNQSATTLTFTTPDPKLEDYPGISPYAYCAGNPIKYIDIVGEEPTEAEAARMADFVYGGKNLSILSGGWVPSTAADYTKEDLDSGYKSMLFERVQNGVTEYALAFAGTDFTSLEDWENNLLQYFGASEQYATAKDNSRRVSKELHDSELTLVGHSLGGGLAAAGAYTTGRKAITFNAVGVSPLTAFKYPFARIDAYVNYRDELNAILLMLNLPTADGVLHIRFNGQRSLGHSIENFYDSQLYRQEEIQRRLQHMENMKILREIFRVVLTL